MWPAAFCSYCLDFPTRTDYIFELRAKINPFPLTIIFLALTNIDVGICTNVSVQKRLRVSWCSSQRNRWAKLQANSRRKRLYHFVVCATVRKLGTVARASNPSPWDAETRGSPLSSSLVWTKQWGESQSRLHSKTLPQKKRETPNNCKQWVGIVVCLCPYQHWVCALFKGEATLVGVVLLCISLMTNYIEQFFMWELAT